MPTGVTVMIVLQITKLSQGFVAVESWIMTQMEMGHPIATVTVFPAVNLFQDIVAKAAMGSTKEFGRNGA